MTTLDVLQRIFKENVANAPEALAPDTALDALNVDSLAMIEVLFAVEDDFKIVIPPEPASWRDDIRTVGDLVDYIDRMVATQRAAVPLEESA